MAAAITLLPGQALLHPAFEPLRPWLSRLGSDPGLDDLNALAASASIQPVTAAGKPVRFCAPGAAAAGHYERKIFETGHVETRPGNRHDLFNALAWLAFPATKRALNERHVARLAIEGARRGPLRDLLTLVDEGGVIVACAEDSLPGFEALIRCFQWQEVFWTRRTDLLRDTRFVLTGHNAYEKALDPYPGITCKSLFIATPRDLLAAPLERLVAWLDRQAAAWIRALPEDARPRQMAPLPVFGRPGWLAQAASAGFYEDRRWFRPAPAFREPRASA